MISINEFRARRAECNRMLGAVRQAELQLERDVFGDDVFDDWTIRDEDVRRLRAEKTRDAIKRAIKRAIDAGVDSEWLAGTRAAMYLRQHDINEGKK